MFSILGCYIRKIILYKITIVFIALVSFSIVIRSFDIFFRSENECFSFFNVIFCLFLGMFKDFELFFTIAILLGGLLGIGVLELNRELMVMQVLGYSKFYISILVIKSIIPISFFGLIFNEWILPNSEKVIYTYSYHVQFSKWKNFKNLWLIDNCNFVCIDQVLSCNELLGVTMYCFNSEKKLKEILFVEHAIFVDNYWNLININVLDLSEEMCCVTKNISCRKWFTILTPDRLMMMIARPNTLSVSELYSYVKYLNEVGQNSNYYCLIFWNKITAPFSNIIMMIVAISFSFGPLYHRKLGIRVLFGSIAGFLFYILNKICGILSTINNTIPSIMGAILPSILFLIFSIVIIWKFRC